MFALVVLARRLFRPTGSKNRNGFVTCPSHLSEFPTRKFCDCFPFDYKRHNCSAETGIDNGNGAGRRALQQQAVNIAKRDATLHRVCHFYIVATKKASLSPVWVPHSMPGKIKDGNSIAIKVQMRWEHRIQAVPDTLMCRL